MSRRGRGAIAANPSLVGAITVLVVVVATFLAYHANDGLPFVPTYKLDVLLPNADGLGRGADVRIGGGRVGRVMAVVPQTRPGRTPVARLELALDRSAGPVPADTTAAIRSVSSLGARFVQLDLGRARRTLRSGSTLVVPRGGQAIELDEVLDTFDTPTRKHLATVTGALGDGLAGRGADLNDAIAAGPALLAAAQPVLARLADPATGLSGFVRGAASAAGALAPEAQVLGALLDDAATTSGAIAAPQLDALLRRAPADVTALTRDIGRTRPALRAARALARDARPLARVLPAAAARTAAVLRTAAPVLRATPAFARRLATLGAPLLRAARDTPTVSALLALTSSLHSLVPTLRFVNPFQTRCNYLGLWARNVPDVIGEGDRSGLWFRYLLMVKPDETLQQPAPATDLHVDPYPYTGQADHGGQCEAGNERYVPGGRVIGNTPAAEPGATEPTTPAPDGSER